MLVLATLIFVGTQWAQMDIGKTKKYTKTRDSFYIAEAGIQRAINFFNFDPATGECPGEAENGFQDELDGGNWPDSIFASPANGGYQGGTYVVTVDNNNDGGASTDQDHTIVLTSTGTKRGVSTTIEATIYRPLFTTQYGIITEDKLTGDGGFKVGGANGLVHSNSEFVQTGSTGTTEGTTANNNCCTCNGESCLDPEYQTIGKVDLPAPDVEFFRPYADFVLHDNGEIDLNTKDSDGNIISTITLVKQSSCWIRNTSIGDSTLEQSDCNNPDYNKWDIVDLNGELWKVTTSNNLPDGIYFVEGSFAATGSSSTAWEVTIISTANIDLAGSREFENYIDGPYGQVIKDAFLVADRDIEISGSVSVNTRGFIHTRDQINLSGNVNLNGWIVAAGVYPSPFNGNPPPSAGGKGLVLENTISGNVDITYDDPIGSPNPACVVKVLSWKEISGIG
jgi:hypothetical protein